ncbi:hypothetical protein H2204_000512 [Knufia peltigerae]|uniref:Uncharacterized protein n=1 Tax=Knufia peltigerae TaxID=1002370 RepID=A0AA38YG21_9EURO|nr:hypothetical protein H2204_000512 [Knufia peltigerae]
MVPSAEHDVLVTVAETKRQSATALRDVRLAEGTIHLAPTPPEEDAMLELSDYCRMRDVLDEAIQRLYWACRQESGFPGDIPDESSGSVTTDSILCGLGLIEPGGEESTTTATATAGTRREPSDSSKAQRLRPNQDRPWALSTAQEFTQTRHDQQEDSSSASQSPPFPSPGSYDGSASSSVPSLQQATTKETNFDMNGDLDQQDIMHEQPSTVPSCEVSPENISSVPSEMAVNAVDPGGYGVGVESYLNVDAFLDANFCSSIPGDAPAATLGDFTGAMSFKGNNNNNNNHGQVNGPLFSELQVVPATKGDSYLSPWPGSLAAAYSSVPPV